jgi:SAM-dependent methyltransferase
MNQITECPCCGASEFTQIEILWPGLINEWRLNSAEAEYINRQQGLTCMSCKSNLRSMTLAAAILRCYELKGTLADFVDSKPRQKVLELNEAGHLNQYLSRMPNHQLASYPDVDMMELPYKDSSFDMLVHSDTLEHINDPVKALKETLRVLIPGGFVCYTVPLVVGRLSKKRPAKKPSYHGTPGVVEYLVHTEYGADAWTQIMEAGFTECRLVTLDYPSSCALIGVKQA